MTDHQAMLTEATLMLFAGPAIVRPLAISNSLKLTLGNSSSWLSSRIMTSLYLFSNVRSGTSKMRFELSECPARSAPDDHQAEETGVIGIMLLSETTAIINKVRWRTASMRKGLKKYLILHQFTRVSEFSKRKSKIAATCWRNQSLRRITGILVVDVAMCFGSSMANSATQSEIAKLLVAPDSRSLPLEDPSTTTARQCVGWVKARRSDLNHSWGDAKARDEKAIQQGFEVNSTPRIGAAFVVEGGRFNSQSGHTGIVESVRIDSIERVSIGEVATRIVKYELVVSDYNMQIGRVPEAYSKRSVTVWIDPTGIAKPRWGDTAFVSASWRDMPVDSLTFTHEQTTDGKGVFADVDAAVARMWNAGLLLKVKADSAEVPLQIYIEIFRQFSLIADEQSISKLISLLKQFGDALGRGLDPDALLTYGTRLIAQTATLDGIMGEVGASEECQRKACRIGSVQTTDFTTPPIVVLPPVVRAPPSPETPTVNSTDDLPRHEGVLSLIDETIKGEAGFSTANDGKKPILNNAANTLYAGEDNVAVTTDSKDHLKAGRFQALRDAPTKYKALDQDYQYAQWGTWNGRMDFGGGSKAETGFWVGGRRTPPSEMAKSGEANYKGPVIGDWSDGTQIQKGNIYGSFDANVDFGQCKVNGNMVLNRTGQAGTWANPKFATTLDDGGFGARTTDNTMTGVPEGHLITRFFGPGNAINGAAGAPPELGGAWSVQHANDGYASGVLRAKKQ